MKKRPGKLQLHRETLRALNEVSPRELREAAGGTFNTTANNTWTSCDWFGQASCEICPAV